MSRPSPRRIALAVTVAMVAHLLALLALGWRAPKVETPMDVDTLPPIELSLVRARPAPPAASAPTALTRRDATRAPATGPRVLTAPSTQAPALPVSSAPSSALAAGPPDCEPEDLPLLNEAERALCRNQIEVEKGRRLAGGADARAAKQVAEAMAAAPIDNIPAEKRAAYDAAVQAAAQPKLAPPPILHGSGGRVGVDCKQVTFPLLSGVEINPNLFRKKHKQERPSHGDMTCSAFIGG